jgi:type I restriction enzyme S subunit
MTSRYRFQIKTLLAQADPLELRLAKARGQVDALTPSLLNRAFAGQVVPQDPADEPVSILINRIKQKGYTHEKVR